MLLCPHTMTQSSKLLRDNIAAALDKLASSHKFLIGLSGGLDSVVLLHVMAAIRDQTGRDYKLRALHVNHQLQDEADSWEQHCEQCCRQLGIEFILARVQIPGGSGLENAARAARYSEFEANLQADEELLLAHHRDDQMETLLLRLMRGSGSRGLSGIPSDRRIGASRLLRPLLDIDREELHRYAVAEALSWVEDYSNNDQSFDRNYCRHSLLPLIEARWPGYRESLSKSAVLATENEVMLQELAAEDLSQMTTDTQSVIRREKLMALSEPRRRNLLRYWLASLSVKELGWNQLQRLSNEVVCSAEGLFQSEDLHLVCFREHVYALAAEKLAPDLGETSFAGAAALSASGEFTLPNNGCLRLSEKLGAGVKRESLDSLAIRYRQGGESCRLLGRPSKSLKKILQEIDTPPWIRNRIPLLFEGERLVCIPGVGVAEEYAAQDGEPGCVIDWEQPNLAALQ